MAKSDISKTVAHTCEISCFDRFTLLFDWSFFGTYKRHMPLGKYWHAGDSERNSKTQTTVDVTSNAGNVRSK